MLLWVLAALSSDVQVLRVYIYSIMINILIGLVISPNTHEDLDGAATAVSNDVEAFQQENVSEHAQQLAEQLTDGIEVENQLGDPIPIDQDELDVAATRVGQVSYVEFEQVVTSLNEKQSNVYETVATYIRHLQLYKMNIEEVKPEPIHVFISGSAGCGKSHLIKAIVGFSERAVSSTPTSKATQLCAPTGVAAYK